SRPCRRHTMMPSAVTTSITTMSGATLDSAIASGRRGVIPARAPSRIASAKASTREVLSLRDVVLVTQAPDRDDAARVSGIALDLAAQSLDVHVERLGVAHVVGSPHSIDERVASEHATGVLEQQREELELLQWQAHPLPADRDFVVVGIEPHVAGVSRVG